jgi:hypothetical protein
MKASMASERTEQTVYRIYDVKRKAFFAQGKVFASPKAAYNAWSYRFAMSIAKPKPGDGWHGNFEMQQVKIVTTTKVVKTLTMVTGREKKQIVREQVKEILDENANTLVE